MIIELNKGLAWKMFRAQRKHRELECMVEDAITRIMGGDPDCEGDYGFDDITFDDYDGSFELKGCKELFELTDEQKQAFANLGFSRAWFCLDGIGEHNTTRQKYYVFKAVREPAEI
jgi:hypothetical protein